MGCIQSSQNALRPSWIPFTGPALLKALCTFANALADLPGPRGVRYPRPLLLVSAFLVREGLTLVQEPCAAKSNEIIAIPRLQPRRLVGPALGQVEFRVQQRKPLRPGVG